MFESDDQAVKPAGTQLESQLEVSDVSDCVERNSSTALVRVDPLLSEAAIEINVRRMEIPKNHLAISRDCFLRLSTAESSVSFGVDASYLASQFVLSLKAIPFHQLCL
jgi:CRISPR/Cas system CSM-associated protein Csm5 (group 7 of RAMP superfamily)